MAILFIFRCFNRKKRRLCLCVSASVCVDGCISKRHQSSAFFALLSLSLSVSLPPFLSSLFLIVCNHYHNLLIWLWVFYVAWTFIGTAMHCIWFMHACWLQTIPYRFTQVNAQFNIYYSICRFLCFSLSNSHCVCEILFLIAHWRLHLCTGTIIIFCLISNAASVAKTHPKLSQTSSVVFFFVLE